MNNYSLQQSEILDGNLNFADGKEGFRQALKDGFFFVKAPSEIDLLPGDLFAENFYKEKSDNDDAINDYRGFKKYTPDTLDEHEGYYCRDVDQTEQFFLEKRFWNDVYPQTLVDTAKSLQKLSIQILESILRELEVPTSLWSEGTGGCTEGKGMYHLTFNHFRPDQELRGLNVHKDSGWVTILRSLEPGLEAFIDNVWVPITPMPGHFIVNFGCAFEIFTKSTKYPVSAVTHRVNRQYEHSNKKDRFSYALFADNSLSKHVSGGLCEYIPGEGLKVRYDFKEFLDNILENTYKEETVGLY